MGAPLLSTRSLILRTLEDTGWMAGGPEGAAARLGLPRTTLVSKNVETRDLAVKG